MSELVGLTEGTVVPAGAIVSLLSRQLLEPALTGAAADASSVAVDVDSLANELARDTRDGGSTAMEDTPSGKEEEEAMHTCDYSPPAEVEVTGQASEPVPELARRHSPLSRPPAVPKLLRELLASFTLPPACHLTQYLTTSDSSQSGAASHPPPSQQPAPGDNGLHWLVTNGEFGTAAVTVSLRTGAASVHW